MTLSSIPPPLCDYEPSELERAIQDARREFRDMGGRECPCGGAIYPDGLMHRRTCACGPGKPLTGADIERIRAEWRRRR